MYLDFTCPGQCWESPKTCDEGFSYCFWIKLLSLGNTCILGNTKNGGSEGFMLRCSAGTMKNKVFTNDKQYKHQPAFSSTTWTHLCATWKPWTLKLYKDGMQWASSSSGVTDVRTPLGTNTLMLGTYLTDNPAVCSRDFVLDDFAFWDRDELTSQNVFDLYNSYPCVNDHFGDVWPGITSIPIPNIYLEFENTGYLNKSGTASVTGKVSSYVLHTESNLLGLASKSSTFR